MSAHIVERRNGSIESIKRNLKGASVTVGLHEEEGAAVKKVWGMKTLKSGEEKPVRVASITKQTLAEVLSDHEFGVGVPRRSVVADWFDEAEPQLKKRLERAALYAIRQGRPVGSLLMDMGKWAARNMRSRIRKGIAPALSEHRKLEKARAGVGALDTPLIFTGQLVRALMHKYEDL